MHPENQFQALLFMQRINYNLYWKMKFLKHISLYRYVIAKRLKLVQISMLDSPDSFLRRILLKLKKAWNQNPAYPAQLGSIKQLKSQVLAGQVGSGFNKTLELCSLGSRTQLNQVRSGYLGSGTQLTQVTRVLKTSLSSLAGFIKTLKARLQLGLLSPLPKQQNPVT